MAIVRNKKPRPVDPSAIAAFGAEADAKPDQTPPTAPKPTVSERQQTGTKPPASSLVRWDKNEELRDGLMDYAKQQRYPVHTVLIMALELGLEQLGERRP